MEYQQPKSLQQQATSQNLGIQLHEPKPLSEFVQNEEEFQIVNCVQNSILIRNLEGALQNPLLLQVVTEWRMYIGIPKTDVSEELVLLSKFLFDNYGNLTIDEIRLAYNLSARRKLQDVEFYGYFSPMYVAKVLDSYLYYRKLTMADVIRRKEKDDERIREEKNRPTTKQQSEDTKQLIREVYAEYVENGEVRDVFNIVYNFMRKHRDLLSFHINKEQLEQAIEYGKVKAREMRDKKPLFERVLPSDAKIESDRYARNWCVQNYFKNVDIDVLLNNIKPELFT